MNQKGGIEWRLMMRSLVLRFVVLLWAVFIWRADAKAAGENQRAAMLTRYRGAGQYDITREYLEVSSGNRTSRGFLYKPFQYPTSRAFLNPKPFQEESGEEEGEAITQAASTQVWPGLVFGHGICAEAEFYEHLLSIVAS